MLCYVCSINHLPKDVLERIWDSKGLRPEIPNMRLVSGDWAQEIWNKQQWLTAASEDQLTAISSKCPPRLKSLQLRGSINPEGEVETPLSGLVSVPAGRHCYLLSLFTHHHWPCRASFLARQPISRAR